MTHLAEALLAALAPPPSVTVSQWADQHRRLSPEASAEPGRWRTERVPYLRGVMDALHDPQIDTVVLMKSSQTGGTEAALNALGYHVHLDPCPILVVQPTLDMARAFSKDRLTPMLRDTPALQGRVKAPRAKDSTNSISHKIFPGGHLTLSGANSPASLASRPIRLLLADEVDRYPLALGDEGDPLALAIKRTTTFVTRKVLVISTPTIKGLSRIEAWYEQSDQREYRLACPACGHPWAPAWGDVQWAHDEPETARLVCPGCRVALDDGDRHAMVQAGAWVATRPTGTIAGFRLWEIVSPWRRMADMVADFLRAKDSPERLRTWVNTCRGETWEESGEQAEPHVLLARRELYEAEVPAGACCLTMGVDTQDDRLELLVLGWGPGEEAWIVDVRTLPGDPARPEPWRELDQVLATPYGHASGARLPILATCIDSAGHRTSYVYDYVRAHQHQRVYATIGRPGDRPLISAPARRRHGRDPRHVDLYTIGVDGVKAMLSSRLRQTAKGPGFVHLPLGHPQVDEELVQQLTAERLVTRRHKGVARQEWVQTRPRNEGLDCAVLAIGALRLLRPNLQVMAERLRRQAAPVIDAEPVEAASAQASPVVAPAAAPPARRVMRSGYLGR